MWLVIYRENADWEEKLERRVFAIESIFPPEGGYKEDFFEIKEWDGAVPFLGDVHKGLLPDFDPTLDDPDYEEKRQQRLDFEALEEQAVNEIEWLEETIPQIDTMTAAEVRDVVKRLAQENLHQIRAWRYVIRRMKTR